MRKKLRKNLWYNCKKGLGSNIKKILIPSEEVIEMKKGKKVSTERKFFPIYVLQMEMEDQIWHIVRGLPKVYGFLEEKGEPIPKMRLILF